MKKNVLNWICLQCIEAEPSVLAASKPTKSGIVRDQQRTPTTKKKKKYTTHDDLLFSQIFQLNVKKMKLNFIFKQTIILRTPS